MSSISGGNASVGAPPSGIQGGGGMSGDSEQSGMFYMGDGEQQEEQQDEGNPELVFVNQAEEDTRSQNRQYTESLITGKDSSWHDPWSLKPEHNLRSRGRRDLARKQGGARKQLIISA